MTTSGEDTPEHLTSSDNIHIPAAIGTVVILFAGLALALTPYFIFHSRQYGTYSWYHTGGLIVGLLSLIPANILLFSFLWPKLVKPVVIFLMFIITAISGFLIFWVFIFIYLATVDWFVF